MDNHSAGTGNARQLLAYLTATPLRQYLTLGIPVWLFLSWAAFDFQASLYIFRNDYWEHSAVLNAWLADFLNPGNPHLATDAGSARYMPYYAVITLIAGMLDLDAIQAMSVAGITSITLFMIATPLFANRYFRDPRAGSVALIVFLCGWGFGLVFSNLYQMRGLLHVIAFPSFFVFSLTLFMLWLVLGILRSVNYRHTGIIALVLLVAVAFSSHPLTGAFSIACLILLSLLEPGVALARRVYVIAAILLGAILVELWPYFSTWKVVLGIEERGAPAAAEVVTGQVDSWIERGKLSTDYSRPVQLALDHPFYRISDVLAALGPAFFGIPVLVYFLAARRQLFIVAGAAAMLMPYLVNIVFPIPLGHRFLLFFVFFLHLALIWLLLFTMGGAAKADQPGDRCRGIAVGFLAFILVWNIGLTAAEMVKVLLVKHNRISSKAYTITSVVPLMRSIAEHIPEDAVVMAPLYLGWPLPTFSGKIVGALHSNPIVPDDRERRRNTKAFFSPKTTNTDRMSMIVQYDVTHILYNIMQVDPATAMMLDELPGKRSMVGDHVIIEVDRRDN